MLSSNGESKPRYAKKPVCSITQIYLTSWSGSASGGDRASAGGSYTISSGTYKVTTSGNVGSGLEKQSAYADEDALYVTATIHNPNPKDRLNLRIKHDKSSDSLGKYS